MGTPLIAFLLLALPSIVFAADCTHTDAGLINPSCFSTLDQFLVGVLDAVILIAFPVVVLFMVYVGWLFVAAQGKPDEIKKARESFFYAIIGALIVLGAKALSLAISATVQSLTPGG